MFTTKSTNSEISGLEKLSPGGQEKVKAVRDVAVMMLEPDYSIKEVYLIPAFRNPDGSPYGRYSKLVIIATPYDAERRYHSNRLLTLDFATTQFSNEPGRDKSLDGTNVAFESTKTFQ